MLAAILAFINMIPGISTAVTTVTKAYYDSKVQLYRIQATSTVEAYQIEGSTRVGFLNAVSHSAILSFIILIFAIPVAIYTGKCIVYDTVLGLGSTPAIHGQVADYMNTIIYGIFGSTSAAAIAQIIRK